LWLAGSLSYAQAPSPLVARLAEIREINRYVPERALPILLKIEAQARADSLAVKAEFLTQLCIAHLKVRQLNRAQATCEELIGLGRAHKDNVALAKGLLNKGYVVSVRGQPSESHRLVREAEQLASQTSDIELRVRTAISAGESYAEEGNFPVALARLQAAASLARQHGDPVEIVMALNSLARLYGMMREFDKGFETLAEAAVAAERANSPGRIATLKSTEYELASDSGQHERGLNALQVALAAYQKIGAQRMTGFTLNNLSDCYLKLGRYDDVIKYANRAIDTAQRLKFDELEASGWINLGQAYLRKGRVAEGKRYMEKGLAVIEQRARKPELQRVLVEFGQALEDAGDIAGALKAYHRERDLTDELFEAERRKAILELQEKYEADKKQREIELLRRENQVKSTEIDNRKLQQRVWWLLAIVFALAAVIVGILYRKMRNANTQLQQRNLALKEQSVRDPLTGLYNRRHFQEFMRTYHHTEKRGAGTSGEEMVGALFLLDVDHFKHINDTYGHAGGDSVLKAIAACLHDILRDNDMIVRWGGEEFLAFLPAIPRSGLDEVARRLLSGISSHVVEHDGKTISANVSIGFAPYPLAPGGVPLMWERAVNLIDMALYLAKAHGRNRAYGVRGFANFEQTSMKEVEQDLEQAWRAGFVDLSIVLCGPWPELRATG
jgi:diguanylate cyclase (GGDEF)-like protein